MNARQAAQQPGYYWYFHTAEHVPTVIHVGDDDAGEADFLFYGNDTPYGESEMTGEFVGPIVPPPHKDTY